MNTVKNKSRLAKLSFAVTLFAVFFVLLFVLWGRIFTNSEAQAKEAYDFVRVGLLFSEDAPKEFSFLTDYGIEYGIQSKTTDEFVKLGSSTGDVFTVRSSSGAHTVAVYAYEKNGVRIEDREGLRSELEALTAEDDDVVIFEHFLPTMVMR